MMELDTVIYLRFVHLGNIVEPDALNWAVGCVDMSFDGSAS
jgi:hypothetical protein